MRPSLAKSCALAVLSLALVGPAMAQSNIRGDATGPTTAPGYSHPEQYMHLKAVKPASNMYPVIQHPELDKNAAAKLAACRMGTFRSTSIRQTCLP